MIRQFGWDEWDWGWGERLRMEVAVNVGVRQGGLVRVPLAPARLSSAMCGPRCAAVIRPKWAMSYDPDSGEVMQHRELINWQMEAHSNLHISDLRVKLGNRVTYDVTHHQFGSPPSRSAMQIGIPTLRNASINPVPSRPLFGSSSVATLSSTPRDSNRDSSNFREIAVAAMTALSPARFTSAQRQMAQRQGGIAGAVAAQRMQGSRGGFANAN